MIPTLERLTPADLPGNVGRRIKVLWIEDEPEQTLGNAADLFAEIGASVDIYHATDPLIVAEALRQTREAVVAQFGAQTYSLPSVPFDFYLGDWDLKSAGIVDGRDIMILKEVEAAGLCAAVLAACHYPNHPALVLPYTAYMNRLKPYGELYKQLAPPAVEVVWLEGEGFKWRQVSFFLPWISALYRLCLAKSCSLGRIAFDFPTVVKLRERSQDPAQLESWLKSNDTVAFLTSWGRRELYVRSLWLDALASQGQDEGEVRVNLLRGLAESPEDRVGLRSRTTEELRHSLFKRWVDSIPVLEDEAYEGHQLAERYFEAGRQEEPIKRYRVRLQIEKIGKDKFNPATAPVDLLEVLDKAEVDIRRPLDDWTWPTSQVSLPSADNAASDAVKRLATLTLLLMDEGARPIAELEESEAIERIENRFRKLQEPLNRPKMLPAQGRLDARFLLDPFPGKVFFDLSIGRHTALGKALDRLDPPLFLSNLYKLTDWPWPLKINGLMDESVKARFFGGNPGRRPVTAPAALGFSFQATASFQITAVEGEADLVQTIFRLFTELLSFNEVAEQLTKARVFLPRELYGQQANEPFSRDSVRAVLTNPIYIGLLEVEPRFYQGDHQSIVDLDLFRRVHLSIGYPLREEIVILRGKATEFGLREESWPWWLRLPPGGGVS